MPWWTLKAPIPGSVLFEANVEVVGETEHVEDGVKSISEIPSFVDKVWLHRSIDFLVSDFGLQCCEALIELWDTRCLHDLQQPKQ